MKTVEKLILNNVVKAISELYSQEGNQNSIQLQKTRKDFVGDFTVVVFPFLRISKKGPEQTAEDIGNWLVQNVNEIAEFNVVKGFLNISLNSEIWVDWLLNLPEPNQRLNGITESRTVMVEYSSPNTNKPLHLGHVRNNLLGYSVSEILKSVGHTVIKTQIINDRGIHICKSMIAWQMFGNGETPESTGIKGDKLVGKYYVLFDKHYKEEINKLQESGMDLEEAKQEAPIFKSAQEMLRQWEAKNTDVLELWETMNSWVYAGFDVTYSAMGVDFDKLYHESFTYLYGKDKVLEGLEKGVFYRKDDGSVWCDLTDKKLDHKLVLRSDGTSVYITQDIGTALLRLQDYPNLNQLIYTVGNEQDHHFKVLFAILEKLGYSWASNCHHLSYGMVDLPSGKMKSREGTVVDADDLIHDMYVKAKETTTELGKLDDLNESDSEELFHQIGLAGLKYFILKVDPKKSMLFNPEESIDFNGNTGPFIQYTYARISALLRRADVGTYTSDLTVHEKELVVIKHLYYFNETILDAANKYSPAEVSNYVYDLVKAYNSFYQAVKIFDGDDKAMMSYRIDLSKKTRETIAFCLNLLGISAPEQM
ncbi:MAG: arginine--tRNA ligase [Salibacteraceae bacterium]